MRLAATKTALAVFVGAGAHVFFAGTARAQARQVPPTFPSAVEVITVDAVVLDGDGQPVSGLTKDDFVVEEDGRPQDVVSFEAFDVSAAPDEPEAVAPGVVASNDAPASGSGRGFAIVIDDLGIAPERRPATQETVKSFLARSVRDDDLVTLGTTSGNAWWSARVREGREDLLAVLARARGLLVEGTAPDRMSDYEAFWIASREDVRAGPFTARVVRRWEATGACPVLAGMGSIGCDAAVRARATQLDRTRIHRLASMLAGVRRAIEALALVRGRKSLLLLSEGFIDDFGSETRAVAALSREANTAVYFVDVRGLEARPGGLGSAADAGPPPSQSERFEAAALRSAGAVALADDTGGFSIRNTNDLVGGVQRVAAESRVFYLLGFHPPEGTAPGKWRKLRVEVKRPGLTVRARRGYTTRSEMTAAAAAKPGEKTRKAPALAPALARAVDSPLAASGIPLRAMAYVLEPRPKDTVHVLVAAEFDAGAVGSGGPATRRLETRAVALLRDTGRGFQHEDTVAVTAMKGDAPRWRSFTWEFELPPGVAQVRVVVRDPATGAIGSVSQRIEIPPAGEFRISTPILTDLIAPATDRGRSPRPALAAHRVFAAGGGLYWQFEVFGAAHSRGAPSRVTAGVQLRSADGAVVREAPATPVAPDKDGRLARLAGASLEGLPEGAYELVLEVRDEVRGSRLERREPFALVRDSR